MSLTNILIGYFLGISFFQLLPALLLASALKWWLRIPWRHAFLVMMPLVTIGLMLGVRYGDWDLPCQTVYAARNACSNNLRQIDGAKEQWAIEHKKTQTDTPTWEDLVGPDKYIKVTPTCPAGGKYWLNNMATKPRCNIGSWSHELDNPLADQLRRQEQIDLQKPSRTRLLVFWGIILTPAGWLAGVMVNLVQRNAAKKQRQEKT